MLQIRPDILTIRAIARDARLMKRCPKCGKNFADDANFCPVDAGRLVAADEPASPATDGLIGGRFELGPQILMEPDLDGAINTGSVNQWTRVRLGHVSEGESRGITRLLNPPCRRQETDVRQPSVRPEAEHSLPEHARPTTGAAAADG